MNSAGMARLRPGDTGGHPDRHDKGEMIEADHGMAEPGQKTLHETRWCPAAHHMVGLRRQTRPNREHERERRSAQPKDRISSRGIFNSRMRPPPMLGYHQFNFRIARIGQAVAQFRIFRKELAELAAQENREIGLTALVLVPLNPWDCSARR